MTACNEATEKIEPDRGMMRFVEEHQDIRTEDFAVMPVGEPRKRRGVLRLQGDAEIQRNCPRKSWIPEEVGCHLQEECVPPCNSGMTKKETLQKK
jgi:hypothetical protein